MAGDAAFAAEGITTMGATFEDVISNMWPCIVAHGVVPHAVIDAVGAPVGTVELLVVTEPKCRVYALISSGGFFGFGREFRLIGCDALQIASDGLAFTLKQVDFQRASLVSREGIRHFRSTRRTQMPLCKGPLLYGPPFP